jgi:predicted aminopeptidase
MRHAKLLVYNELRDEYNQLKAQWNGYSGYDRWFSHTLNNAQLASVATYYDLVPAFIKLLQDNGNDLKLFYTTCQKLAKKSEKERRVYLERH